MLETTAASADRLLSVAELLRVGGDANAIRSAAAWGSSALVLNGCLCLEVEPSLDWNYYAGRGGFWGYLGARSPDLLLGLGEAIDAMHLPAPLAVDLLPIAMQTMIERSRLAHGDDWLSAIRDARMSRATVGSWVSAATTGRSLFPSSPGVPRN
jgi:hypothetical protein